MLGIILIIMLIYGMGFFWGFFTGAAHMLTKLQKATLKSQQEKINELRPR